MHLIEAKNTVGRYFLEGSGGTVAGQRTDIYMVEILRIGIVMTQKI